MAFKELKPTTDEEWLKIRQTVLTASDIAVILGLNPWKSVQQLVDSKKELVFFENAYTIMGQWLEPVVVLAVNRALGTSHKLFENGSRSFFVDEEIGLGATPDAGSEDGLLECKTTKPYNCLRWAYWPPSYYLTQLYTQMICCNQQKGILAVMSTNLAQYEDKLNVPMHITEINREEWLDTIIFKEVKRYWECQEQDKKYRVDRKQTKLIELKLRFMTKSLDNYEK